MNTKLRKVIGAYFLSFLMLFSNFVPTYGMIRDMSKGETPLLLQTKSTNKKSGSLPLDQVDLSTGNVTLQESIFSVEGYHSVLTYNSEGVTQKASIWNRDQKQGVLGLGWEHPEEKIIRLTQQTGTTKDDDYLLYTKGTTYPLLFIAKDEDKKKYRIANQPDWIVKHHITSDQWELYYPDGEIYIYGDGISTDSDKNLTSHVSQGVEHNIKWNNWIGSSTVTDGQSQLPVVYNISAIENIYGEQVKFFYHKQEEQVGNSGQEHTRATYLSKVEGLRGKSINYSYKNKDEEIEFDSHTEAEQGNAINDQDAYQERYENKYLFEILIQNKNGSTLRKVQLEYDFLKEDTELRKRLLTKLHYLDSRGDSYEPATVFDYFGLDETDGVYVGLTKEETKQYNSETGALYAAIKQQTRPEGVSYAYQYGKHKVEGSNTDIEIIFPENPHNNQYGVYSRWSAPELFYGSDYVVAIFESQDLTHRQSYVKVYQWIGDRWYEKDLGVFEGYFYDRYLAKDQYKKGVLKQIKNKAFEIITEVSPLAMGVINGFEDALKQEAKTFYKVGDDIAHGEIRQSIQDWYTGQFTVLKSVALDLASGFEKEAETLKGIIDGAFGSTETQFDDHQKQLYKARDKDAASNPRKQYHITLQDQFFVLASSLGESQVNIIHKNNIVSGEWIKNVEIANLTSKHFTLDSAEKFVALLDEVTDFIYIYSWDGHSLNTYSRQLRTDFNDKITSDTNNSLEKALNTVFGENGEVDEAKLDHRSAISVKNNLIVAAITDSHGIHADISLLYHDENMNWKSKSKKLNKKAAIIGDKLDLDTHKDKIPFVSSLLGKDGKIDLKAGNSFAVLQTYDNWNENIPSVADIPILGDLIHNFVPDMKKINSTYGIVWDENYENIRLSHLHTATGQEGVETFIVGDVINKIGKSHSLLLGGNDIIAPSDGKNYAFRYNGKTFVTKEFNSPYYTSGFSNDIVSTMEESSDKTHKIPKFYQYDPNTEAWALIENASQERISTSEFINEVINVYAYP